MIGFDITSPARSTPKSPPSRVGFGSRLVKLEVTHELNGAVELIYDRGGLKVVMEFPLGGTSTSTQLKQGMLQ